MNDNENVIIALEDLLDKSVMDYLFDSALESIGEKDDSTLDSLAKRAANLKKELKGNKGPHTELVTEYNDIVDTLAKEERTASDASRKTKIKKIIKIIAISVGIIAATYGLTKLGKYLSKKVHNNVSELRKDTDPVMKETAAGGFKEGFTNAFKRATKKRTDPDDIPDDILLKAEERARQQQKLVEKASAEIKEWYIQAYDLEKNMYAGADADCINRNMQRDTLLTLIKNARNQGMNKLSGTIARELFYLEKMILQQKKTDHAESIDTESYTDPIIYEFAIKDTRDQFEMY